jgi:DNA-binding NtrC family response regulator
VTKILVIEQGGDLRACVVNAMAEALTVESVGSVAAAVDLQESARFEVIVWDLDCESESRGKTLETLNRLSDHAGTPQIILVGGSTDTEEITDEWENCQCLRRPFEAAELKAVILSAIAAMGVRDQRPTGSRIEIAPIELEGMIAMSMAMRMVFQQIGEAAAEDVPVLITGETGTGKDLVAAAIHKKSKRKNAPYLALNMGAIAPELIASELFGHEKGAYTGAAELRSGFFEQAQHGTLFLDEITTMDEKTQVSLLRVLETKTIRRVRGDRDIKVDVRVVAATNEKIEDAVKARRFREDLYYRLDVFGIHLPPLRERSGGVTLLTQHFVALFASQYQKDIRAISPLTYRLLRRYDWPGNVRELKNVIQRAVLMAKGAELTPDLLPARIRQAEETGALRSFEPSPIQLGMTLADVEKEFIKMTVASVAGNKLKAAEIMGVSRRALYNKLKRHGLM